MQNPVKLCVQCRSLETASGVVLAVWARGAAGGEGAKGERGVGRAVGKLA